MTEQENPTLTFDFDNFVSQLKTPVSVDKTLANKFKEATTQYCQEAIDLDEAVATIEQDVRNYLAERR